MRTLAVIPARLGATRLPRKPLRLVAGLPLIVRVWERVAGLDFFDRVIVATDSDEIAAVVTSHGGVAELTGDHDSGTDRIAAIVERGGYTDYDAIVNVQGDEPFVSRAALLGAARMVTEAGYGIGTAAVHADPSILADPNVVKVVTAGDGRAMYFSRAPIPFLRDPQDAALQRAHVYQHLGIYAYRVETLLRWKRLPPTPLEQIERLEQLRPLAAGITIGVAVMDEAARPGIDTEADLERANRDWTAFTTG